jgi:hypothetical protein
MRRFLFLSLSLALLLSVPALAVEGEEVPQDEPAADAVTEEPVTVETIPSPEEGMTVNVTIQQPETASDASAPADSAEDPAADLVEGEASSLEDGQSYRTYSVTSPDVLETVQSGDGSSVMADVVVQVLGEYQPKTQTVQELDSAGNVIATSTEYVPGLAGLDYHWITGAVLFTVFLLGIFKLLGGLMRS